MGIDDLLRPMTTARRAAAQIPAKALEDATLTGVKRTTAAEAAAVGLVKEARKLEDVAELTKVDVKQIEAVERRLIAGSPGLRPSTGLIGTVTTPPLSRLDRLFGWFSLKDRLELGERAIRLAHGKSVARALRAESNMAGQLREVVAKFLPEVIKEVRLVMIRLRAETRGSGARTVIDSSHHGAVELPGRLRGNDRFIRLGTDRIVGVGIADPQLVRVTWSDGTDDLLEVAGELDASLAIEIKGRTTATGGIEQIIKLQDRGQRGYALIGNQLWLLKYDPAKVTHLVIAAPGDELNAAAKLAAAQTAAGRTTKAVPIPLELDDQVKQMARNYLTEAALAR